MGGAQLTDTISMKQGYSFLERFLHWINGIFVRSSARKGQNMCAYVATSYRETLRRVTAYN
jgi:hypothetical protein